MKNIVAEFEDLYNDYQNASCLEERQVKVKLDEIRLCYDECGVEERTFADEIIKKFCYIIELINEHNDFKISTILAEDMPLQNYVANTSANCAKYQNACELLDDFNLYLLNTHKVSTAKDYVARIKTFAERYLQTIPRVWDMYNQENNSRYRDPILFTYKNLEVIIASFTTREADGSTNKQKNNLRSALRKLNDFKQKQETK